MLFNSGPFALAQKDVLIQEKNKIIQEITYIKDQINQTELDKKSNLKILLLYEKDAELRESLIKNYEKFYFNNITFVANNCISTN